MRPHRARIASRWLPPLLWVAAIYWFSTDAFSASRTGSVLASLLRFLLPHLDPRWLARIHLLIRKGAHVTVYAVLALLLLRALSAEAPQGRRLRWVAWAFLAVSACAFLDEYHQSFTRERTSSVHDSLIDIAGGSAALLAWTLRGKRAAGARRGRPRPQPAGGARPRRRR